VWCVRRIFSSVTDPCKTHRYSYQIPDYAQYVYDHCARLNPKWVAGSTNPPCHRVETKLVRVARLTCFCT
jgi:hypothetical protein